MQQVKNKKHKARSLERFKAVIMAVHVIMNLKILRTLPKKTPKTKKPKQTNPLLEYMHLARL